MSDIRVKGFDDISFWREDDIGLIVIRSSSEGQIRKKTLDELIMALSTASIDPSIRSIAITGQNDVFCRDIGDWENPNDLLSSLRALASIMYSLEKPVSAIVNGDAMDTGYELALLCDSIIASPLAKLGFKTNYMFSMGGSLSSLKFTSFEIAKATEKVNCDYVFPAADLLGVAKEKIQEICSNNLVLRRKNRLRFIREAVGEEHIAILSKLSENSNMFNKSKEIGV